MDSFIMTLSYETVSSAETQPSNNADSPGIQELPAGIISHEIPDAQAHDISKKSRGSSNMKHREQHRSFIRVHLRSKIFLDYIKIVAGFQWKSLFRRRGFLHSNQSVCGCRSVEKIIHPGDRFFRAVHPSYHSAAFRKYQRTFSAAPPSHRAMH